MTKQTRTTNTAPNPRSACVGQKRFSTCQILACFCTFSQTITGGLAERRVALLATSSPPCQPMKLGHTQPQTSPGCRWKSAYIRGCRGDTSTPTIRVRRTPKFATRHLIPQSDWLAAQYCSLQPLARETSAIADKAINP